MVKCPNCFRTRVRAVHWRWYERPIILAFKRPARCSDCWTRFYLSIFDKVAPPK